ncbi:class I SAM-dependent methyltransferase [Pseudonocardia lacus]|uniref:class I SAM-dependent methyltransferase n=1 Tax=Pseudonocardia lacus TaxID=2835865 RepID=UPI001BDD32D2|nr:class I SAM-dependent methyltransferase [Pseudonocardia lacus]
MRQDRGVDPSPPKKAQPDDRISRATVASSFDQDAAAYDRLVAANPGYHEHLRMSARRMGIPNRGSGMHLLDLGCGTGASTEALLAAAPDARITAVDASKEMLAQAATKTWPPTVRFVHADAEDLAAAGITGEHDGILAAYLLRNLVDRDAALRTFRDLLRPGAPLALHEYSVKDSPRSRAVWTAVCWAIIIPMGRLRTGSGALYRYLWRSVLDFDGVRGLTERMRAAGFEDIKVQTFPGWQQEIVHTFLGRKPGGTDVVDPALTVAPTPPEGIDITKP